MMMFSINPMYDYGHGEFSIGSASERYRLYTRCEKEGVGISVMKPFNAGQLLDAKKSPFGQALTPAQCIQYALDRPAVLTVMQGAANVEELKRNLSYLDASAQERDYSVIATLTPKDTKVVSWRIVNNSYNRKYPSDHFPVVIEWSLAE